MGLNVACGNMYQHVTHTWNPIKGKCLHDCSYCYMKRRGKLNPVRLDEKELKAYIHQGLFIFVGSSCDMFADDIPDEWIIKVLRYIRQFPYTDFLLQSKNPKRILPFLYPADTNFTICTTIETNRIYPSVMGNTPSPKERAAAISNIFYEMNSHDMRDKVPVHITIEPVLDFDIGEFVSMLYDTPASQINIGADSCYHHLPEPPREKVLDLISRLQKFTEVVCKPNLKRIIEPRGPENGTECPGKNRRKFCKEIKYG